MSDSDALTLGLVPTEQVNPRTAMLDLLPVTEMVQLVLEEERTVLKALEQASPQIARAIEAIRDTFLAGNRLFYIGAGTSGRLGVLDASECPPTFGVPEHWVTGIIAGGEAALRHAIEGAEDDPEAGVRDIHAAGVQAGDVLVGLSASGGAPYVLAAIDAARALGAWTVGVTCHNASRLAQMVDCAIAVSVGPEVIAGSSRLKAGTAQKQVLNLLSTGAMVAIGKTYGNLMVDVQPTNQKLKARALRLVMTLAEISQEQAEAVLQQSGFQVKPAVLMGRFGISLTEAQTTLQAVSGKLRVAMASLEQRSLS